MADHPSARLPHRPSLEQLRKQAKDLLRAWRDGDAAAATRVRAHKTGASEPALTDAQFALAREYGFESWPTLVHHVESLTPEDLRSAPAGLSSHPPFYRIDWAENTIEPRQPMTDRDWDTIVAVIREYDITSLNANGQLTDAGLERVAQVEHLTRLNLGGSRHVTDDGLTHLARMPQLEDLDLSEYPGGRLTDRGLEVLRQLPELRRFQMCWQSGISDAGVSNLSSCDKLERVDLLGSPTGDGAIRALRGKPRLRLLKTGRLMTDEGLRMLHDLPVFKRWQGGEPVYDLMTFSDAEPNYLLVDGPFSDAGAASLAGLEGVFGLGFFWHCSALTSAGLAPLSRMPNLGALGCQGQLCDDTAMRHIAAIPKTPHADGTGHRRNRPGLRHAEPVADHRVHLGTPVPEPAGARVRGAREHAGAQGPRRQLQVRR